MTADRSDPLAASRSRPRFWTARRRQWARAVGWTSVLSIGATLLIGWATTAALRYRQDKRLVKVSFATDQQGIAVQLKNVERGVTDAQMLPTQRPFRTSPGEYRVDVYGTGRVSRGFDATLAPGDELGWSVPFNGGRAMRPRAIDLAWTFLSLDRQTQLVELYEQGLRIFDPSRDEPLWTLPLAPAPESIRQAMPEFVWRWPKSFESMGHDQHAFRPWVIAQDVDLDGDEGQDFLCAAQHQAWILAISGRDGRVLWSIGHGSAVAPFGAKETHPDHSWRPIHSANLQPPQLVPDQNGDDVPEVVATFGELTNPRKLLSSNDVAPSRRYIECLSGATGTALWQLTLDDALFEAPPKPPATEASEKASSPDASKAESESQNTAPDASNPDVSNSDASADPNSRQTQVPVAWRWFVGQPMGSTSMGGSGMYGGRRFVREDNSSVVRDDAHAYRPGVVRLITPQAGDSPRAVVLTGARLVTFDPTTGRQLQVDELPSQPIGKEDWADVDGDGVEDLVYLERAPSVVTTRLGAKIVVWSMARRELLWTRVLSALAPHQLVAHAVPAPWPLLSDLDGDGAAEIIAPDGSSRVPGLRGSNSLPWGDLVVFDGKSGEPRWRVKIPTADQQIDQFIAGPDVNGDGQREVYAVSLSDDELLAYLDVFSGRDGRKLWSKQLPLLSERSFGGEFVQPLRWWQARGDGWPQLLITIDSSDLVFYDDGFEHEPCRLYAVSAGTGRLEHFAIGVHEVQTTDLNDDGVEDLATFVPRNKSQRNGGGQLDSLAGAESAPWSRLGETLVDSEDFDGDGLRDLIGVSADGTNFTARSGRTGKQLWKTPPSTFSDGRVISDFGFGQSNPFVASQFLFDIPEDDVSRDGGKVAADLDGDGVRDVLVWDSIQYTSSPGSLLTAVSGRTGRFLWQSRDLRSRFGGSLFSARIADLDGDGSNEILVLASFDPNELGGTAGWSGDANWWWCVVLRGATGERVWMQPLEADATVARQGTGAVTSWMHSAWDSAMLYPMPLADLDGDSVLDCIVPGIVEVGDRLEYRALSGRDGRRLWRHALPKPESLFALPESLIAPVVVKREGQPVVYVTESGQLEERQVNSSERWGVQWTALEGRTGKVLWTQIASSHGPDGAKPSDSPFDTSLLYDSRHHTDRLAARPTPVQRGDGRRQLLSCIPSTRVGRDYTYLRFLDLDGNVTASAVSPSHAQVRVLDVDADGRDELAFIRDGQLQVAPIDQLDRPLWKHLVQASVGSSWLVEFIPAHDGQPPVLCVWSDELPSRTLVGLNARTGQPLWTVSPGLDRSVEWAARLDRDAQSAADQPPLVAFMARPVTRVVRAASVSRDAELVERSPPRTTDDMPPGGDPRWQRQLPWNELLDIDDYEELWTSLMICAMWSVTLVIVPVGYVGRMILRRQWNLRSLFVLPVIVGVMLTVLRWEYDYDAAERYMFAVLTVPPLLAMYCWASWVAQRQWRRLRIWLIVLGVAACVVAFLVAALQFWRDCDESPMLPGEYYVWDRWYVLIFPTLYVLTWPMMLAVALLRLWAAFKSRAAKRAAS